MRSRILRNKRNILIVKKYFEDISTLDIAEEFNISKQRVSQIITRVLEVITGEKIYNIKIMKEEYAEYIEIRLQEILSEQAKTKKK